MDEQNTKDLAGILKALGEFNRLSLVYRLCKCASPQNAMCLCDCCNVDASGVSRHLKILEQEGVVSAERKGRETIYSLNKEDLPQRLRSLADLIEQS